MRRFIRFALLALLATPLASAEDICRDKVQTWREFSAWAQAQPDGAGLQDYRAKLLQDGIAAARADDTVALIGRLYEQCSEVRNEAQRSGFNRLYRMESQTRFTTEPSAFLVATVKKMKPGKALDVAMGQGRNVIFLASRGWDVTGYDIAEEGLKVAQENARKAGVRVTTVHAGWDEFDHGREQWDLISFIYTDAPVMDPKFIARIQAALKPGGYVLFDRPYRNLENPEPSWGEKEHDKPNALPKAWSDLQLVAYEDTNGVGDWQQTAVAREEYPQLRLVHMLARKLPRAASPETMKTEECRIQLPGVTFTRSLNGAAAHAKVAAGALTLASEARRDNFRDPDGKLSNDTAPLLLTEVDNTQPFTFTARVTPTFLKTYDAGALYIYVRDDLWLKMAMEMDERQKTRMVSVRTIGTSDDNNHDVVAAKSVFMKISSNTKVVGFYYSLDNKTWQLIRLFKNDYPASISLGISSQSPLGEGTSAVFEDVSLTKRSISDFRLGI